MLGFPGGTNGKELTCQFKRRKRCKFDLWVGKIPWRRAWQPNPVFLPGESPRTEESCGLWSLGSQRVRHDGASKNSTTEWNAGENTGHQRWFYIGVDTQTVLKWFFSKCGFCIHIRIPGNFLVMLTFRAHPKSIPSAGCALGPWTQLCVLQQALDSDALVSLHIHLPNTFTCLRVSFWSYRNSNCALELPEVLITWGCFGWHQPSYIADFLLISAESHSIECIMKFIQVGLSLFSFSFKLNDLSILLLISMTFFFCLWPFFYLRSKKWKKKFVSTYLYSYPHQTECWMEKMVLILIKH